MPKSLEFWAIVISILAIGISIFTWFRSHKIDRARRNDEERDQNSADIRAHLERDPGKLVVENIGNSEARNISIRVDNNPLVDAPGIQVPDGRDYLIGPHSHISFRVSLNFQIPVPQFIEINWDDDDSTGKTYRNSLSY
ncbi:hypothetical protein [Gracilimonas sp. BCB1]|uniref:hypothetical protein n=1 Tax=Gracilimonas sp. BCB1 TaxID=3152362 RepID=UPI0032D91C1B